MRKCRKKTKRNKQHSTAEKNIKTDINNEEKFAQKKTSAATENKTTIEKPHKCRKTTQKAPISTEMLKNVNRRQKLDKAQKPPLTTNAKPAPPDNDKMTDKRRKPTKPRTKRAINGKERHTTVKQAAKP